MVNSFPVVFVGETAAVLQLYIWALERKGFAKLESNCSLCKLTHWKYNMCAHYTRSHPEQTYLNGTKVGGFSKKRLIFGIPKFRSLSLFSPNYFSRIFLNYDFIDLLSI